MLRPISTIKAGVLVAVTCFFTTTLFTQPPNAIGWRVFTPSDRSFYVQLPEGSVTELSSERGDLRGELFEKGATYYLWGEEKGKPRFSVLVVDMKSTGLSTLRGKKGWMDYLAIMTLGDDDEAQFLSKPVAIFQNGIKAHEYKYIDAVGSNRLFSRGRLFELGNELVILKYEGTDADDLTSADANRFFNSFAWTPRLRTRIPATPPGKGMIDSAKPLPVRYSFSTTVMHR